MDQHPAAVLEAIDRFCEAGIRPFPLVGRPENGLCAARLLGGGDWKARNGAGLIGGIGMGMAVCSLASPVRRGGEQLRLVFLQVGETRTGSAQTRSARFCS